jgi:hypothetical protein
VVAAADIVDARVRDLRQELPGGLLALLEQAKRRERANPGGWSDCRTEIADKHAEEVLQLVVVDGHDEPPLPGDIRRPAVRP